MMKKKTGENKKKKKVKKKKKDPKVGNGGKNPGARNPPNKDRVCFVCGEKDHMARANNTWTCSNKEMLKKHLLEQISKHC